MNYPMPPCLRLLQIRECSKKHLLFLVFLEKYDLIAMEITEAYKEFFIPLMQLLGYSCCKTLKNHKKVLFWRTKKFAIKSLLNERIYTLQHTQSSQLYSISISKKTPAYVPPKNMIQILFIQ